MSDGMEKALTAVAQDVIDDLKTANAEIERLRAEVDKHKQDGMKWRENFLKECFRAEKAEAALNIIAGDNWSSPPVDCEASNTYAHIVAEMQRIALEALAQKEPSHD